jgi:hypothetical protein
MVAVKTVADCLGGCDTPLLLWLLLRSLSGEQVSLGRLCRFVCELRDCVGAGALVDGGVAANGVEMKTVAGPEAGAPSAVDESAFGMGRTRPCLVTVQRFLRCTSSCCCCCCCCCSSVPCRGCGHGCLVGIPNTREGREVTADTSSSHEFDVAL